MDFRDQLYDTKTLKQKQYMVQQMYAERSKYEPVWRDLSRYIFPWRGRFDEENGANRDAQRRDQYLIDPYPMEAITKCSAGLHSGLTSPSRPWFKLSLQDKEKAEYHPIRMWLDDVQEVLMGMYARSNTYKMLYEHEAEMPQFGTSASLMLEDYNYGIWHQPFTCGEYAGAVDARGKVTYFCRRFELNAQQLVSEFGFDEVSTAVQAAYRQQDLTSKFKVEMLIEKNTDYDPEALAMGNFPWRSWYWEYGRSDKMLRISGYHEQPFLMPRWQVVANETYGTGLGHSNIGNCMQLQKLEKNKLRCTDNDADPAMIFPASYKKINRLPGAMNFVPDGTQMTAYPLVPPGAKRYEGMIALVNEKRQQIAAGFYNDLMVMLTEQQGSQPMTAREVAERHEEKLLMLGPVLEQFHNEVLEILTLRSFGIGLRNGLFPPMPEDIGRDELKVNFISLLAQAQQMADLPAITNTVGLAGNMAGLAPEAIDIINMDEVIRQAAIINGAPEKIIRSEDEVNELRQERQQQQQEAAQQQQMMQEAAPSKAMAEAAKTMSETPVNGRNALEQILSNIGGGL